MHHEFHLPEARRDHIATRLAAAEVDRCETWVETDSLLITKVFTQSVGHYYAMTVTDLIGPEDTAELLRLEGELGRPLEACGVEVESYDRPHPYFPGSSSFIYQTVYGGSS